MAQSTQSTQYDELARVINRFVFADTTTPTSGDDFDVITDIIRRGLRKFYMPPPLPGDNYAHVWSFLKKKGSLDIRALPSGTATTDPWNTTSLIDSAATFTTAFDGHDGVADGESLEEKTLALTDVSAGITYYSTITSVTNATTLVVPTQSSTPAASTTDTYTVGPADWNLPEDFGALIGDMTYRRRTAYPPLQLVSEAKIRTLRQDTSFTKSTRPQFVAIRAKKHGISSSIGIRWEVMIWPDPDSTYTLEYNYWVAVDQISASADFPAGAQHGEAIMAACMWVAQEYADPQNRQFNMHERFIEALRASVMFDRQLHGGEHGGYNADNSDLKSLGRPFRDRVSNVTYNNTEYP